MKNLNIQNQNQDKQCIEMACLALKGMSLLLGMLADSMDKEAEQSPEAAETNQPSAKPEQAEQAEQSAETPDGAKITVKDVQRAMGLKIKSLSAKGGNIDQIGDIFPKFGGASCLSELNPEDYSAFLAELEKL